MDISELRARFNQVSGGDAGAIKSLQCDLVRAQISYGVGSWAANQCYYMKRGLEVKAGEYARMQAMAQAALLSQQAVLINRMLQEFAKTLPQRRSRSQWAR